jgi:sulfoxide reductase heme-binding subunit YedZ
MVFLMSGFTPAELFRDYIKALRKQKPPLDATKYGITSPFWGLVLSKLSELWNLLLVVTLMPLLALGFDIGFDNLGSNPIEALHISTGTWALRFFCITLLITPIQKGTRWRGLAHFRQLFGLLTFFYASLHVYGYIAVDQAWEWETILTDVTETTYIWYGLFSFVVLSLLALTSIKPAKKVMGKNWKKLHRWIYPASVAAVLHYFMQLKGNLAEPLIYALIIGLLLSFRVLVRWKERQISRLMIPKRPAALED